MDDDTAVSEAAGICSLYSGSSEDGVFGGFDRDFGRLRDGATVFEAWGMRKYYLTLGIYCLLPIMGLSFLFSIYFVKKRKFYYRYFPLFHLFNTEYRVQRQQWTEAGGHAVFMEIKRRESLGAAYVAQMAKKDAKIRRRMRRERRGTTGTSKAAKKAAAREVAMTCGVTEGVWSDEEEGGSQRELGSQSDASSMNADGASMQNGVNDTVEEEEEAQGTVMDSFRGELASTALSTTDVELEEVDVSSVRSRANSSVISDRAGGSGGKGRMQPHFLVPKDKSLVDFVGYDTEVSFRWISAMLFCLYVIVFISAYASPIIYANANMERGRCHVYEKQYACWQGGSLGGNFLQRAEFRVQLFTQADLEGQLAGSERIGMWNPNGRFDHSTRRFIIDTFHVGSTYDCYYDPDELDYVLMTRDFTHFSAALGGVLFIVNCVFFYCLGRLRCELSLQCADLHVPFKRSWAEQQTVDNKNKTLRRRRQMMKRESRRARQAAEKRSREAPDIEEIEEDADDDMGVEVARLASVQRDTSSKFSTGGLVSDEEQRDLRRLSKAMSGTSLNASGSGGSPLAASQLNEGMVAGDMGQSQGMSVDSVPSVGSVGSMGSMGMGGMGVMAGVGIPGMGSGAMGGMINPLMGNMGGGTPPMVSSNLASSPQFPPAAADAAAFQTLSFGRGGSAGGAGSGTLGGSPMGSPMSAASPHQGIVPGTGLPSMSPALGSGTSQPSMVAIPPQNLNSSGMSVDAVYSPPLATGLPPANVGSNSDGLVAFCPAALEDLGANDEEYHDDDIDEFQTLTM